MLLKHTSIKSHDLHCADNNIAISSLLYILNNAQIRFNNTPTPLSLKSQMSDFIKNTKRVEFGSSPCSLGTNRNSYSDFKFTVESHANSNTKILFASDYLTYILAVDCNKFEGIRWIGVFTPTPYPTAEDLLGVRNTLIDLNVTSPLNFSQCHGRKLDCLTHIISTHHIIERYSK
uniref:uncharacterized protein LOC120331236 n=1 Tax=Styela clava TaxID=7725 RepID=UPI00193A4D5E|nr:uncharacterized protein LOC120331236 [Styela clava]